MLFLVNDLKYDDVNDIAKQSQWDYWVRNSWFCDLSFFVAIHLTMAVHLFVWYDWLYFCRFYVLQISIDKILKEFAIRSFVYSLRPHGAMFQRHTKIFSFNRSVIYALKECYQIILSNPSSNS